MAYHPNHRRRGGQPGNQNARKHGFYTLSLSPVERTEFMNLTEKEGMGQDLALLRIRIKSILENDPPDRRALARALKLLTNWAVSQYHLEASESRCLRMYFRSMFVNDIMGLNCPVQNNPLFNKTIESKSAEENL